MSVTTISVTHDLNHSVNYVVWGNGEKGQKNRENNTPRPVASYCSISGGYRGFLKFGHEVMKRKGKTDKVGFNIVQSFNDKQFDIHNKRDAKIVNGLGVELAHRLYPNSPTLVETHDDGDGGHLHNHITVLNYDLETYTTIRKNTDIRIIRGYNDTLMRENGLSTVSYGRNFEKEIHNEFDLELLGKLRNAQNQAVSFDDYIKRLQSVGVTTIVKEKNGVTGLTYKMMNNYAKRKNKKTGKQEIHPRLSRRKASRYGKSFTFDGLQAQFQLNREKREQEKEKHKKQIQKMLADKLKQQKRVEIAENQAKTVKKSSKKREFTDKQENQNQIIIKRVHVEQAQSELQDNTTSNDKTAIQELNSLGETVSSKKSARQRRPRPQHAQNPKIKRIKIKKDTNNRKNHEKIILPSTHDVLLDINTEEQRKKYDDSKQF